MDGKGIEFAVDELVIMRHGPGDIVRVDEDDVEPLMDLAWNTLGVLQKMLTAGGFGLLPIIKKAVGATLVAVVVVVVGKAGLVSIGVLTNGSQKLIGLLKLVLLGGAELVGERFVE